LTKRTDNHWPGNPDKTFRWHDYCRVLKALGMIEDFSRGECFRARRVLLENIEAGRVEQVKRGEYRLSRIGRTARPILRSVN
jgi:hypothetical protein